MDTVRRKLISEIAYFFLKKKKFFSWKLAWTWELVFTFYVLYFQEEVGNGEILVMDSVITENSDFGFIGSWRSKVELNLNNISHHFSKLFWKISAVFQITRQNLEKWYLFLGSVSVIWIHQHYPKHKLYKSTSYETKIRSKEFSHSWNKHSR